MTDRYMEGFTAGKKFAELERQKERMRLSAEVKDANAAFEESDAACADLEDENKRLTVENSEFRTLLRMVLANLRNPILGGISDEQIIAIDEALDYPFDSVSTEPAPDGDRQ